MDEEKLTMPCDSIILNQVHLGLSDPAILAEALKDLGALQAQNDPLSFSLDGQGYRINRQTGDLESYAGQEQTGATADRIKQAYSKAVVKKAASRFGWSSKIAGNKIKLTK